MDITILEGYLYTKEHEWVRIEGPKAKIGISDYAQQKLGDITYIDPTEPGKKVKQFEFLTGVESVKAASDIYAPLSGTITAFNTDLDDAPELVNKACYTDGWIAEIEVADPGETKNLMDAAAYKNYTAGLE
ncbi:MAG TPA: glycine cleavage system protein GcvH [Spirochaetota bacterium]|nr:glycine cleavage system protein GcvH [Spirochaetota bacterium]HPC42445.1 glycine cleavage system protein GcvH [Spirochaetota bacterium]HPL17404.1 glycine cleavage system protein GcvH [Spirochaetota bacterium]HQF06568.1 glycine cleavage system protein GcvH [Spirochaetota bacterium]HQH96029.1 glycine cleavage system protein GcvH [Spirochaetota bacterium]